MNMNLQFNPGTRFFTVATAGHVDHGKTSLLRKLTGIDPDRLKEEKERQMTTDLGFAYLPLQNNMVLGFVDVPGHGKFLKNMLAGVGGIDLALLVVAADEGPMPQTRQHVRILSLLGVSKAIVAINKIDLIEDAEQIELVREETEALLSNHGIEALAFCKLSSTKGTGFEELKEKLGEILDKQAERILCGALFLPVDRVFSKSGFGTVITGTLVSGKLAVGDQIYAEPGNLSARVRRLETHGQSISEAHPGQRVACNIVLKEGVKLKRGFVLCSDPVTASRSLIVSIYDRPRLLAQALSERLCDQPVRLYHGTAEYQGYLRWVEDRHSEEEASEQKGQYGIAFLALSQDAVLEAQDKFVIRLTDDSIYGGSILLKDRPRFLSKGEILKLADLLDESKFEEALRIFLDEAPQLMLKETQLQAILPESKRRTLIESALSAGWLTKLADYYLTANSFKELSKNLRSTVKSLSELEENSEGASLESTRQNLHPKLERTAFQALIEAETSGKQVVRNGDKLRLPGQEAVSASKTGLSDAEMQVKAILQSHWCLEIDEIAQLSGLDLKKVKAAILSLVKTGELVMAGFDFVASRDKIREAHEVLSELWNAKKSIAPTDFKEKIGVTRKYAMALLQYFDDAKITRRLESGRVLLKGPQRSK